MRYISYAQRYTNQDTISKSCIHVGKSNESNRCGMEAVVALADLRHPVEQVRIGLNPGTDGTVFQTSGSDCSEYITLN